MTAPARLQGRAEARGYPGTRQATAPAQDAPQAAHGHHRYQSPPTVLFDGLSLSAWTVVAAPVTATAGRDGTLWFLSRADRDRLLMAHAAGRVLIARQRQDGALLVVAKFARRVGRRSR